MVISHHPIQIAIAPAQVMAHDQLAGSLGVLAVIVWSDVRHIGLCGGENA
jgi:hypothetical protein